MRVTPLESLATLVQVSNESSSQTQTLNNFELWSHVFFDFIVVGRPAVAPLVVFGPARHAQLAHLQKPVERHPVEAAVAVAQERYFTFAEHALSFGPRDLARRDGRAGEGRGGVVGARDRRDGRQECQAPHPLGRLRCVA